MRSDYLFLRRYEQIEALSQEITDEVLLFDLAGLLRQMLFDSTPLMHIVNTNRIRVRFAVEKTDFERPQPPVPNADGSTPIAPWIPEFEANFRSIDAVGSEVPEADRLYLSLDRFARHRFACISGEPVTVRMVVKLLANIKGGVHFDARPSDAELAIFEKDLWRDESYNPNVTNMWGLGVLLAGQATVHALRPLVEDVASRQQPSKLA
jgi:hypothetical protein